MGFLKIVKDRLAISYSTVMALAGYFRFIISFSITTLNLISLSFGIKSHLGGNIWLIPSKIIWSVVHSIKRRSTHESSWPMHEKSNISVKHQSFGYEIP